MKKRLMNSSSSHRRNDQHLQHSDSDLLAVKTETDRDCDHEYVHKTSKSSIENNHGYGYHPKKICLTETSLATSTSTSASVFIAHERDSRDYDAAKDLIDMCKTMSIKAQQFPLPPTTTTGASNCNYQGPMPMSMPMLNNDVTFISQPLYHTNPPTSMSHTNYTTASTCTTINPSTTSNYQSIIPRVASRSTEEYSEHSPVLHHPSVMDYNEGGVLSFNETARNHQSIPVSVPMSVPVTPSIPPKVQVPACITRSSMKQKKSSVASSTTHTIQSLRKKKAVSSTKKITKVTAKKSKAQSKAKAKVKVMVNSRGKTKASGTSAKKESLPPAESITTKYYGSFSLYNKRDEDVLSPIHCFIRQYGIEAFVATEEDATDVEFYCARNFKIKPGLVCTRCKYCKHLPLKERSAKSMHYPSNMDCLYYSMENWLRYHSKDCEHIPLDIKEQMNEYIIESRSRAGGRKGYWKESAMKLGLVNTKGGVVATVDPEVKAKEMEAELLSFPRGFSLVDPSDKGKISSYLFLLMSNMESCTFTETDRIGSRSKNKDAEIGYPGFQCMHCRGSAGKGRYFPESVDSMRLANSDRNMKSHLLECHRVSDDIKESIKKARKIKMKNDRGSRKELFEKVWGKLHGPNAINTCDSKGNDESLVQSDASTQSNASSKDFETPYLPKTVHKNIPCPPEVTVEVKTSHLSNYIGHSNSSDHNVYHGSNIDCSAPVMRNSYDDSVDVKPPHLRHFIGHSNSSDYDAHNKSNIDCNAHIVRNGYDGTVDVKISQSSNFIGHSNSSDYDAHHRSNIHRDAHMARNGCERTTVLQNLGSASHFNTHHQNVSFPPSVYAYPNTITPHCPHPDNLYTSHRSIFRTMPTPTAAVAPSFQYHQNQYQDQECFYNPTPRVRNQEYITREQRDQHQFPVQDLYYPRSVTTGSSPPTHIPTRVYTYNSHEHEHEQHDQEEDQQMIDSSGNDPNKNTQV